MDPPLRETMLMRGDVDAITGFSFTSLLNLEARGARRRTWCSCPYAEHGVKLYGNVIIATPKFIKEKARAAQGLPARLHQGRQRTCWPSPTRRVAAIKERDGLINVDLEKRRLRLAIDAVIASPECARRGFGQLAAAPVADGQPGV